MKVTHNSIQHFMLRKLLVKIDKCNKKGSKRSQKTMIGKYIVYSTNVNFQ